MLWPLVLYYVYLYSMVPYIYAVYIYQSVLPVIFSPQKSFTNPKTVFSLWVVGILSF